MPECTCRGTNPNCFKCGGWGWLGDDIAKHRGGGHELAPSLPNHPRKPKKRRVTRIAKRTIGLIAKRGMVQCEFCGAMVREDRITSHRYRVHNNGAQTSIAKPAPARQPKRTKRSRTRGGNNNARRVDLKQAHGNSVQPSYEPRFGDKYLGYPAREDGRYGSISLYDDYGDESSAE